MSVGFLSCLCGSELTSMERSFVTQFLSCLCGSEHMRPEIGEFLIFLSCLCGSEPSYSLIRPRA